MLAVDEPSPRVLTRAPGGKRTPTFRSWQNMQRRCYDPHHLSYPQYGARGVCVYFEWLGVGGFAAFAADVGVRPSRAHTLDRIDSGLGYQPGNVRWLLAAENSSRANSQAGNNVTAVDPDGVTRTMSLRDWAEHLRVPYRTLCRRLQRAGTSKEAMARAFAQRRSRR